MEKYGYTYSCDAPDWAVSLPGTGVSALLEPCFSVPASHICIGKILWIAGMFECAVRRAAHSAVCYVRSAYSFFYTRVSVVRVTRRFKL